MSTQRMSSPGFTGTSGRPVARRSRQFPVFRIGLFVMFLLAIYVDVPLFLTATFVIPSVVVLLVLMPILVVMYHRKIYKYEAAFVMKVFAVLLLSAFLSPGLDFLSEKALGLIQASAAVVSGVLFLKLLDDLRAHWVAKVLLVLSVVLVAGALLEVLGVLSTVSESFREVAFKQAGFIGFYEANERDVGITGFPRPKFFTAEPSLLAMGFFAFANSWLALNYSRKSLTVVCLGTLLMFVLTGSPVLVLSLAVSLIIVLFNEPSLTTFVFILVLGFAVGLALVYTQPDVLANFIERVGSSYENAGTTRLSSENRRIVFPFITLVDVLWAAPIFGVGIGGKEVIERYASLPIDPSAALGNNALAWFFIYCGLVGSFLIIKFTLDYWRRAKVGRIALVVVMTLALTQMMAGPETPRFWGYMTLFAGVVKKASSTSNLTHETSANKRAPGHARLSRRPMKRVG